MLTREATLPTFSCLANIMFGQRKTNKPCSWVKADLGEPYLLTELQRFCKKIWQTTKINWLWPTHWLRQHFDGVLLYLPAISKVTIIKVSRFVLASCMSSYPHLQCLIKQTKAHIYQNLLLAHYHSTNTQMTNNYI